MTIIGLGLDMLDISRMETKLTNHVFMEKIYTQGERDYISSRGKFSSSSAAGIFCAKEAFMKAVGEGLKIPAKEIEVCRDARGKPYLCLKGKTNESYGSCFSELSITHTATTAAAVVLLFSDQDRPTA